MKDGRISPRTRCAGVLGGLAGRASRLARRGNGTVVGGAIALRLAPGALRELAALRSCTLVSGTNGKTTTTALLSAALGTRGRVATSTGGANMPAGLLAALLRDPGARQAVLEVDEAYLPTVVAQVRPRQVVLLNLSRDQLDRHHEVRALAEAWREALRENPPGHVVANADDPLVVWAAHGAPEVTWVAAGLSWTADAVLCPRCSQALTRPASPLGEGWACMNCGLERPDCTWALHGPCALGSGGTTVHWALRLPGRANRSNATMALAAALAHPAAPRDDPPAPHDPDTAQERTAAETARMTAAMADVADVAGRYSTPDVAGHRVRLLLAKNPAGWAEALQVLDHDGVPVVLEVDDDVADGRDPSWLWDVDFTSLRGRPVWAVGTRAEDLAVRLTHDGVEHRVSRRATDAIAAAAGHRVEYVGNYTAFRRLRDQCRVPARPDRSSPARPSWSVGRRVTGGGARPDAVPGIVVRTGRKA